MELPPSIGRILDLNEAERVNIELLPPEFVKVERRFGGGDGGGNGIPGISALPFEEKTTKNIFEMKNFQLKLLSSHKIHHEQ